MMRLIVASLTGIFMALYIMYFFAPLLSITHTNFSPLLNSSDPVIATSFNLGSGFYTAIPLIPILVGGFIIISYSIKGGLGE